MVGDAAERLEQAALGGGLDAGRTRQRRELRHDPRLLRRRQRAVLEAVLEQARGGLGIAALLDEAGERPGRFGVVRAQREHALVGGARGGRVADARLQHLARCHQRGDPDVVVGRDLGLAQLRIGERARIVIGRRDRGEHRERRGMLGDQRERGVDRLARAGLVGQALEPELREPDVQRRELTARDIAGRLVRAGGQCIDAVLEDRDGLAVAAGLDQRGDELIGEPRIVGRDRARVAQRRGCLLGRVEPLHQDLGATRQQLRAQARIALERGAAAQHVGDLVPPRVRRVQLVERGPRVDVVGPGGDELVVGLDRAVGELELLDRRSSRSSAARRAPRCCLRLISPTRARVSITFDHRPTEQ